MILILTPWYSERGRESSRSRVEGRVGTHPACGPTGGQGPGSCAAVSSRPLGGGAAHRAARSSVVCGKGRGAGVKEMGREDEGSSREAPRLNLARSLSGVRVLHFGSRSWFSRIPKWAHASCELLAVKFLTLRKRCYRHIRGF